MLRYDKVLRCAKVLRYAKVLRCARVLRYAKVLRCADVLRIRYAKGQSATLRPRIEFNFQVSFK